MTLATVRFTAEGWHRWPGATKSREYLGFRHRHLFHVTVSVNVHHDDREIEFHDLLDFSRESFGSGEFGDSSCEQLARSLLQSVMRRYPERFVRVEVYEDGEVGAQVEFGLDRDLRPGRGGG